tara:strand:+ start:6799 stop:8085 length:1287 start_codon:yes stop_codon:yes gene_type:complete
MADTLAEIYRNTLTSSSFDSNGEATIVTTNSSTSHVIKSIQVSDTDTNVPINGTLKINDFDIVALTGNSSGTEIIAPSSTVKVKSASIPFTYEDIEFNTRRNATQYTTTTDAKVNGYLALTNIYTAAVTSGMNLTEDSTENTFAPNMGPNNYHYNHNYNHSGATTSANIYNNSGTQQFAHQDNNTPKWFDGKQYAYYYGARSGSSGNGINRIDIYAATSSRLLDTTGVNAPSGDPKMFGTVNADYTLDKLFFWSNKNDYPFVYDAATNSTSKISTSQSAASLYGTGQTDNQNWFAIKRTNGNYRFVIPTGNNEIRYYDWEAGTTFASGVSYTQITPSGNSEIFNARTAKHSVIGTKLYYLNDDGPKVAAWDFDPNTPTHSVVGTNNHFTTYGADLTAVVRTPSTSTVNARSYGISPSLKLRISGVTST